MIYFDNAATTPIDKSVLASFNDLVNKYFANPSSSHKLGLETTKIEEMARNQIARLMSCLPEEVIFTSGATESNNLAIKGVAFKYQNRGKHIITSTIEHPSVYNAFKCLENDFGFQVSYIPVDSNGVIDLDVLKKSIREDTILVSIMSVNNEVGSINNIEEIASILKDYPKIMFHTDATQAIGKIDINYSKVDLISMSAHKLHGFKGSGLLIKRKRVDLMPLSSGGGQEFGYRSGTNNFPYEVSLAKTLRLALESQKDNYIHVKKLYDRTRTLLAQIDGITFNSPIDSSPYILNFCTKKKASVVQEALSLRGIFVSTKSACSSKKNAYSSVIASMGKSTFEASNSIRISFARENTIEEVEEFAKNLKEVLQLIK